MTKSAAGRCHASLRNDRVWWRGCGARWGGKIFLCMTPTSACDCSGLHDQVRELRTMCDGTSKFTCVLEMRVDIQALLFHGGREIQFKEYYSFSRCVHCQDNLPEDCRRSCPMRYLHTHDEMHECAWNRFAMLVPQGRHCTTGPKVMDG